MQIKTKVTTIIRNCHNLAKTMMEVNHLVTGCSRSSLISQFHGNVVAPSSTPILAATDDIAFSGVFLRTPTNHFR